MFKTIKELIREFREHQWARDAFWQGFGRGTFYAYLVGIPIVILFWYAKYVLDLF